MSSGSLGAALPVLPTPQLATALLHTDDPDHKTHANHSVAPSIQTSTTFRSAPFDSQIATDIRNGAPLNWQDPGIEIYSRYNQDTRGRTEKVLSKLMGAEAITFGSGVAAGHACMQHYAPSVIAIRKGYMGIHAAIAVYRRGRTDLKIIDLDDEYPTLSKTEAEKDGVRRGGLLVWVETPLNPTGEVRDLKRYVQKAHAAGGYIGVDATLAPPPLQDPFKQGADFVMHSATKYMGGHSDLLVGVVAVKSKVEWESLFWYRVATGAVPGNLESYLLLRSLRTITLRVQRQSETAHKLAQWLYSLTVDAAHPSEDVEDKELVGGKVVEWVWHGSLQPRNDKDPSARPTEGADFDPRDQMPGGFSACFSIRFASAGQAAKVPHSTEYFTPATSLGGVESLLEHRILSQASEDPRLVRISVGLEDFADLQADLRRAFQANLSA
ncbi:cystathionine gamma-synthase [Tilletiaria anomala UBC 951]|uniref:Cystathionine gamma-synthase n=1 Tax=Tilletiaria anomala (strain ATCC 24038 / CBS 436.72 / UBC 951) TaxID=1037660 RepID=A0A066WE83_TILAU|nr:cystathionine gamma-synthase [Tilletiaria anomala UBC 951]KDN52086.1 cystathionine gamma-synthase [Tilletiaria anomala UBC 951]